MDLQNLYKLLSPFFSEERVLKVYQFGSRVWGTAAENADWDFFVVIEDYDGPVHPELELSLVGCQVDISAYNVSQWAQLLREHDMLALVCEHLPSPFVWKDVYNTNFMLSLKTLVRGASKEMSKCLSMSHVHFVRNGDRRTGLKNFVHATRYIGFATQLATHGELDDLGVSNQRQKEAMEHLTDDSKTYEDFLRLYKPEIMRLYSEFHEMVQNMITNEVAFATSLETEHARPTDVLLAYLEKRSLTKLRRYFSVLHTRIADSIFLLESNEDSPEGNPITGACGSVLIKMMGENTRPRLLAQFHGYIDPQSLDSPKDIPSHLKNTLSEYAAIALPANDVEVLMWFSNEEDEDRKWLLSSPSNSACANTFRKQFESCEFLYPSDTSLSITWLFNSRTLEMRPLLITDRHGRFCFDLMTRSSSFMNWPSFNLELLSSDASLKIRASELEKEPHKYKGLYIPHTTFGYLIASRSHSALQYLRLHADFYEQGPQPHNRLKYIALALCSVRNDIHQSPNAYAGLDTLSVNAIRSEIETCQHVINACDFFWSLVKEHSNDTPAFAKEMHRLKFWNPVISIMSAIRSHVSQDPQTYLFASPLKVYQHWATVFDPAKITRLIQSVSPIALRQSSAEHSNTTVPK